MPSNPARRADVVAAVLVVLLAVLGVVAAPAAAQSPGRTPDAPGGPDKKMVAVLEVPDGAPPEIDFGVVARKAKLAGTIVLRNVSDRALVVRRMATTCRCTSAEDLTGETLAPGEEREVTVEMEAKSRTGTNRNEVSFIMSDGKLYKVGLTAEVVRAVTPEPPYLVISEPAFGLVRLSSADGRPFRILSASYGPVAYADGFRPGEDEPRASYMLSWNLEAFDLETCENEQGEKLPMWWALETDHPGAPVVELRVRHDPCTLLDLPQRGGREWYLSDQVFVLDAMQPGDERILETDVKWLPRTVPNDEIKEVVSNRPDLYSAELVEVVRDGDDATLRIRVRVAPGARGLLFSTVEVRGFRPGSSTRLHVIARAVPTAG